MILAAYLPVLACVVGALLYAISHNPKAVELGRITFAAGMFALLFALSEKMVRLLG